MLISSNRLNALLRIAACAGFVVAAADLGAQTTAPGLISLPVVGLLQNKTEVRGILGVAGSSTIGEPILFPLGTTGVYLAPAQRWALVRQLSGLGFMTFNGIHPSAVTSISGAVSTPDMIAFSPTGRAAVLVSNATGLLQVLTGLDGTPQVAMQAGISDLAGAGIQAAAVSDDGSLPVVLTGDGRIYLASAGASSKLIFQTGVPAGLSFLPNQPALAIADGNAATVSVMDGLANLPFPRVVVSGPSLSGDHIFMQGSSDGKSVVMAAGGATTAYRIDLTDRSVRPLDVPAGVSQLERLGGSDVFLFSANPGEAAWLLLADSVSLKTGFAQAIVAGPGKPVGEREPLNAAR